MRSSWRSRKQNAAANFSSAKDGKGTQIKVHGVLKFKMTLELDKTQAKIPFNSGRERNFKPKNGRF